MKLREFFNLQLFADQDPANPDTKPGEPIQTDPVLKDPDPQKHKAPGKPEPKYTDEDLDRILGKKFAAWEEKKQKEIDEAKRLAGMSAQEQMEHELQLTKGQLEQLMKQQSLSEMSKTARSILAEKNININDDLLSLLVSEDADQTKTAIDSFVSLFQDAVRKEVAEALKGNAPKTGTTSGYTKDQILAVRDRAERQRLIKENLSLFQ